MINFHLCLCRKRSTWCCLYGFWTARLSFLWHSYKWIFCKTFDNYRTEQLKVDLDLTLFHAFVFCFTFCVKEFSNFNSLTDCHLYKYIFSKVFLKIWDRWVQSLYRFQYIKQWQKFVICFLLFRILQNSIRFSLFKPTYIVPAFR